MAKVHVPQKDLEFEATPNASLMNNLLTQQIPVASSCNGEGVCGKCRVQVLKGLEKLHPPNKTEEHLIKHHKLQDNERISCQTTVSADLILRTSYW